MKKIFLKFFAKTLYFCEIIVYDITVVRKRWLKDTTA